MKQNQEPVPQSRMSGFSFPKKEEVSEVSNKQEVSQDMLEESAKYDLSEDPPAFQKPSQENEVERELTYKDRLSSMKISFEEATKIIDALTTENEYLETHKISQKISIKLTTRDGRFNSHLAEVVDIADPKKVARMNNLMSEYQVAASLVQYGEEVLPNLNNIDENKEWLEVLNKKLKYVRCLSNPVFLSICNQLASFDLKLMTVFSPGYEENF